MTSKYTNHAINYVELPAADAAQLVQARGFYSTVFGWQYQEWGPQYADTQSSGVASGINGDADHKPKHPLVILYADDLKATREAVVAAGGKITKDIFSFPGGQRFHFTDPAGNELAVWAE
jgi:uncharacterized protein